MLVMLVRVVRMRIIFVFVENVPAHLQSGQPGWVVVCWDTKGPLDRSWRKQAGMLCIQQAGGAVCTHHLLLPTPSMHLSQTCLADLQPYSGVIFIKLKIIIKY